MKKTDVISLISKIREKSNQRILSEMERHGMTGLATSHGDIISALMTRGQMTMAEIADKIRKDKSTVTVLVEKLTKLGYIKKERDEKDTRIVYVSLTEKGKALEPAFHEISEQVLNQFYKGVTEEEQELLLRLLMKIYGNF